jgi:membrane associated rhomboid family serine protease
MWLIIAANVLVFAYQLNLPPRALDGFIQSFGLVPTEFLSGEDRPPYTPGPLFLTLFTAMFIHGGFLHIGSNMLYLWVFGDNVEDVLGHTRFLAFYLLAGIAAGLAHTFVNAGSDVPSVGASGAIAGVLAGYLVYFPSASIRTLLFLGPFITVTRISAIIVIGIWFVIQLFSGLAALDAVTAQSAGVAFWAHIGGFVAGLVMGLAFKPFIRLRPAW